jgi:hypothetical protein
MERQLIQDAHTVRSMPNGPEKDELKAKLVAAARELESKPGYTPSYRPGYRPSGPTAMYPPTGPGGFPMAPHKSEVLVPLNVLKQMKGKEGDDVAAATAAADRAKDTHAPGILDYPWYQYLNPQPGFGGWQETFLEQRHAHAAMEAAHLRATHYKAGYLGYGGAPNPRYGFAVGNDDANALDENGDGVIDQEELENAADKYGRFGTIPGAHPAMAGMVATGGHGTYGAYPGMMYPGMPGASPLAATKKAK